MSVLEVRNLEKIYTTRFGGNQVIALTNVNFSVENGEYVAIMGESGSGKSLTSLSVLGLFPCMSESSIKLLGQEMTKADDKMWRSVRGEKIGFAEKKTAPIARRTAMYGDGCFRKG